MPAKQARPSSRLAEARKKLTAAEQEAKELHKRLDSFEERLGRFEADLTRAREEQFQSRLTAAKRMAEEMDERGLGVNERELELTSLSDGELVFRVYDYVRGLDEDADELYALLGEAFERWAPAAEYAEYRRNMPKNVNFSTEIRAVRDSMERRWRARLAFRAAVFADAEVDDA